MAGRVLAGSAASRVASMLLFQAQQPQAAVPEGLPAAAVGRAQKRTQPLMCSAARGHWLRQSSCVGRRQAAGRANNPDRGAEGRLHFSHEDRTFQATKMLRPPIQAAPGRLPSFWRACTPPTAPLSHVGWRIRRWLGQPGRWAAGLQLGQRPSLGQLFWQLFWLASWRLSLILLVLRLSWRRPSLLLGQRLY